MSTEQLQQLISELEYRGLIENQADFGRKLGYKGRSYISNMVNGAKPANIDNNVLKAFPDVNPQWIITGEGGILKAQTPASFEAGDQWKDKYLASVEEAKDMAKGMLVMAAEVGVKSGKEAALAAVKEMSANYALKRDQEELHTMVEALQLFAVRRFSKLSPKEPLEDIAEELSKTLDEVEASKNIGSAELVGN